jgi:hypothetical protein
MKWFLLTLLTCAISAVVLVHFLSPDGWGGIILKRGGWDSTEYTKGYSDSAFRRISRGMSEADVLSLIGEPMERFGMRKDASYDDGWQYRPDSPDAEGWDYSRSRNSSHYRMRIVVFRSGKVFDVIAKVYID